MCSKLKLPCSLEYSYQIEESSVGMNYCHQVCKCSKVDGDLCSSLEATERDMDETIVTRKRLS